MRENVWFCIDPSHNPIALVNTNKEQKCPTCDKPMKVTGYFEKDE